MGDMGQNPNHVKSAAKHTLCEENTPDAEYSKNALLGRKNKQAFVFPF